MNGLLEMLRVFVFTSNKYVHVVPGFAHLFNRFWGDNQSVTVVGFEKRPTGLPRNFNFLTLGRQDEYTWSSAALRFLELIQDEHFILLLEDYYLSAPVNIQLLERLYSLMLSTPQIVKADLSDDRAKLAHDPYDPTIDRSIIVSQPETLFQTSLQAAIWRRDFMQRFLDPRENPWAFEKNGTKRVLMARKKEDFNGVILGSTTPPVRYINAIGGMGNHPHKWAWKYFPRWMVNELNARGLLKGGE